MKFKKILLFMLIAIMAFTPVITNAAVVMDSDQFSRGEIVPFGKDVPTEIHDLSTKSYKFDFITVNDTTMYTSYRFTGHDGKITLTFTENGGGSGKYEVAVCKINIFGFVSVLTSKEYNRGESFGWQPSNKIGSSEIVFIRFKPLGNGRLSGEGTVSTY